jgi:chorismate mutase
MDKFDLTLIANRLESLEETIVFRLLDRVQYKLNPRIYSVDAFSLPNDVKNISLLDYMHKFTEQIYAQLGRFTIAEEKPFFETLALNVDTGVIHDREFLCESAKNSINLTAEIKKHYNSFINTACENGDDSEYGSSAEADIAALIAISKRVHYGSFYVAESKFLKSPDDYVKAVKAGDEKAVMEMLTRREIEEKIILRVIEKCDKIQAAYTSNFRKAIDGKIVGAFYENAIIPLTKLGELQYLFRRCENEN